MKKFQGHNGFTRTFKENTLTLGLLLPLESFEGDLPIMDIGEQVRLIQKVEKAGFASLFVRDSPLYDPDFGDAGIIYDPFMFLTYVAAQTKQIALGTASIVTTLRHPLHTAKQAATLDKISNKRFLFGTATGDRPIEFPAFNVDRKRRVELYQESIDVMRQAWKEDFPQIQTNRVDMTKGDIIPKPALGNIPIFGTGFSGQTVEWLAQHTDGWMFYAQEAYRQEELIKQWRDAAGEFKPFAQPLVIDLAENPKAAPHPVPVKVGFRSGRQFLLDYLLALEDIGVNHVMLNVKHSSRPAEEVIDEIGEYILPHFQIIS